MSLHSVLSQTTDRILERSHDRRSKYMSHMRAAAEEGPRRAHRTCGNQAQGYAAMGDAQQSLAERLRRTLGL